MDTIKANNIYDLLTKKNNVVEFRDRLKNKSVRLYGFDGTEFDFFHNSDLNQNIINAIISECDNYIENIKKEITQL